MNNPITFFLMIMATASSCYGAIGCMDDRNHRNYKEKPYQYVQCSCNCEKHHRSFDRGRCEKCRHYRASDRYHF